MNESCIICYEEIYEQIEFNCKHKICIKCYEEMINKFDKLICPLCRNLIEDNTEFIKEDEILPFNNIKILFTGIIKFLITIFLLKFITKYL